MNKVLAGLSPLERLEALQDLLHNRSEEVLEKLSPLSHFEIATETHASHLETNPLRLLFNILAALYSFDYVFQNTINRDLHIYLLGDETLIDLCHYGNYPMTTDERENLSKHLELLSAIGLIYRFNVARKFGYHERGVMQLRLNSWGRHAAEHYNLQKLSFFKEFSSQLCEVVSQYKKDYDTIVKLCNSFQRPLEVHSIHDINLRIPLQVVT